MKDILPDLESGLAERGRKCLIQKKNTMVHTVRNGPTVLAWCYAEPFAIDPHMLVHVKKSYSSSTING